MCSAAVEATRRDRASGARVRHCPAPRGGLPGWYSRSGSALYCALCPSRAACLRAGRRCQPALGGSGAARRHCRRTWSSRRATLPAASRDPGCCRHFVPSPPPVGRLPGRRCAAWGPTRVCLARARPAAGVPALRPRPVTSSLPDQGRRWGVRRLRSGDRGRARRARGGSTVRRPDARGRLARDQLGTTHDALRRAARARSMSVRWQPIRSASSRTDRLWSGSSSAT